MKHKVLIVDDEKNIRLTLKTALSKAGYEVETAVNGEDGLTKLKEEEIPVVLLDMKMPGMDGIQFLKEVTDKDIATKVIMITGYSSVETAVETLKLGAVDYLRKPFKPEEIISIVEDVFERHEIENSEKEVESFDDYIMLAKNAINKRDFSKAKEMLQEATSLNSEKPEPFNFLGIIYEMQHKQAEAMKMYRAALALDPGYKPANDNIERAGESMGSIDLDNVNFGDDEEEE
ncbi:MAG: response regulator receiver protein [Halanaerobium sp. 4-GBenrich]|jgi:DNA-binding NtrC family response regulator|uniref:Stage 0 sporulation protein A homolog n=1 Tax=Halanaerobium congolense TaxID=54121 RepID=A0A1G6NWL8_9FIRM|nr:response regulator [Halanaerobium congolense]KXS47923.1 MAG: response regulator receiver protein [Halanaerobium sp. T82-1]ODS50893.1 MAG: response regulator receiver protein [Halanaerobium sp. 4-GBenrich]PUU90874.1 MAG: response regulator receiver protein [Halanaerobium sp.]PTX17801.1 response regulator receiver domain-containing protein [Halanaerobium congolense]TDP19189.1 response regulator receiver domain-containing protein [Halanaerobium congolense]